MSYDIYLYPEVVKSKHIAGNEIDEFEHPNIDQAVLDAFVERLLKYDYELETDNGDFKEFIHKNKEWSIQVSVFKSEIAFSVPFWDDAENAIFEALQNAHELCDSGHLFVYDPQTGEWSD